MYSLYKFDMHYNFSAFLFLKPSVFFINIQLSNFNWVIMKNAACLLLPPSHPKCAEYTKLDYRAIPNVTADRKYLICKQSASFHPNFKQLISFHYKFFLGIQEFSILLAVCLPLFSIDSSYIRDTRYLGNSRTGVGCHNMAKSNISGK